MRHDPHDIENVSEPTASGTTAWSEDVENVDYPSQGGKK